MLSCVFSLAGPLAPSTVNQVVVQFPTGDPNTDYKTRVRCRVIDAYVDCPSLVEFYPIS